jgi:hypothetical protein
LAKNKKKVRRKEGGVKDKKERGKFRGNIRAINDCV